MNGIVKILMVLFLLFGIVVADNIESLDKTSIDIQIEHIKNADPKKRRELMNRFKEQLATMNRKERMSALRRLFKKMHLKNGKKAMGQLGHKPFNSSGSIMNQQKNMFHHPFREISGSKNLQAGHHRH